jgi:hypothetical protein
VSEADFHIHQNAAEYVLFMWQTEDLLRACKFDEDAVMEVISSSNEISAEKESALRAWYASIIQRMQAEGITEHGHLNEVHELVLELFYLHNTLLNVLQDKSYEDVYQKAAFVIKEYRERSDQRHSNDVEVCFHALYMKILLKLKGIPISADTEEAMKRFRDMLALLSTQFKRMKEGDLNFGMN